MKALLSAISLCLLLVGVAPAQDSLNCRGKGSWPFGPSYAVAYDASRNLAFCGSGGGVYVLDVSNPAQPQKLSEAIHTRGLVYGLCYQANRLYIAAAVAGLEIWDVTNPAAPARLGYYDTPSQARAVAVAGNYAYVADDEAGLRVISVSDPAHPSEVGYCDTPGCAEGVAVAGDYAYVADRDSGLRVISVLDPAHPTEVGYCYKPGRAEGVRQRRSEETAQRAADRADHAVHGQVGDASAAVGARLAHGQQYVEAADLHRRPAGHGDQDEQVPGQPVLRTHENPAERTRNDEHGPDDQQRLVSELVD